MPAVKNVVLVHGAWADGSSWAKIVPTLQAAGLTVSCVQIPLSDVDSDVAAATRIINAQDGPVFLAGHSYGGYVITEAGVNPKVVGLGYVAAFAPDVGQTLTDLVGGYPATPTFTEGIKPIDDGYLLLTAEGLAAYFAQDLSAEEKGVMAATQGATSSSVLGRPCKVAAWHDKPSYYIVANHDTAIQPDQERFHAKNLNAKKTISLDSSHVPMLSKPKEVAAFLIEAVKELSA